MNEDDSSSSDDELMQRLIGRAKMTNHEQPVARQQRSPQRASSRVDEEQSTDDELVEFERKLEQFRADIDRHVETHPEPRGEPATTTMAAGRIEDPVSSFQPPEPAPNSVFEPATTSGADGDLLTQITNFFLGQIQEKDVEIERLKEGLATQEEKTKTLEGQLRNSGASGAVGEQTEQLRKREEAVKKRERDIQAAQAALTNRLLLSSAAQNQQQNSTPGSGEQVVKLEKELKELRLAHDVTVAEKIDIEEKMRAAAHAITLLQVKSEMVELKFAMDKTSLEAKLQENSTKPSTSSSATNPPQEVNALERRLAEATARIADITKQRDEHDLRLAVQCEELRKKKHELRLAIEEQESLKQSLNILQEDLRESQAQIHILRMQRDDFEELAAANRGQGVEAAVEERDAAQQQLAQVRRELEAKQQELQAAKNDVEYSPCPICNEHNREMAFRPCGHTICQECSTKWRAQHQTCPVCGGATTEVFRIYTTT